MDVKGTKRQFEFDACVSYRSNVCDVCVSYRTSDGLTELSDGREGNEALV